MSFDPIANPAWELGSTTRVAGGGQDGCQGLQMLRFAELSSIWSMVRLRAHPSIWTCSENRTWVLAKRLTFQGINLYLLGSRKLGHALSGRLQQRVVPGLDNPAELGVFGSLEGMRVVR